MEVSKLQNRLTMLGVVVAILTSLGSLGVSLFVLRESRTERVEVRVSRPPAGTDLRKLFGPSLFTPRFEFYDIVNMGERAVHVRSIEPPSLVMPRESVVLAPGEHVTIRSKGDTGMPETVYGKPIIVHTNRGIYTSEVMAGGAAAKTWSPDAAVK